MGAYIDDAAALVPPEDLLLNDLMNLADHGAGYT
jgi:hypothetical protein